jgi:hypothetical protein
LPFLIVCALPVRPTLFTQNEQASFSNYYYWQMTHPFLTDDDNPRTSFRAIIISSVDVSGIDNAVVHFDFSISNNKKKVVNNNLLEKNYKSIASKRG